MCLFEGHHSWSHIIFFFVLAITEMLPGILNQLVSVLVERKKDDGRTDQSHPNGPYWLFANETNFHLGGYMFRCV